MYYVRAEGSDTNDGRTEETAFRTLAETVRVAASDTRSAIIVVIGTLDSKSEGLWTPMDSVFYIDSGYRALITIRGKPNAVETQKAALKSDVDGYRVVEIAGNTNIRFEYIEISGGRSELAGGGMAIRDNAHLTASEGTFITDNESARSGGGVAVFEKATFNMTGGVIANNTAVMAGGGVALLESGVFAMSAGEITGNKTAGAGGGVVVASTATFTQGDAASTFGNTARVYIDVYRE